MPPKKRGGLRAYMRERQQQYGHGKPPEYKPRDRYPPTSTPGLVALRSSERAQIVHFRKLRKAFQDGPLYTVLDASTNSTASTSTLTPTGVQRPGEMPGLRSHETNYAATVITGKDADPFEALPTFSQKYKKPRRPVPQLSAGDYIKDFFPLELHQYIDSTSAPATTNSQAAIAARAARAKLTAAEEEELMEIEAQENEEEEEVLMEEEDDDFEEDEDEDDDYNAENYFSDGKSDAGGGDDGGGGDDY